MSTIKEELLGKKTPQYDRAEVVQRLRERLTFPLAVDNAGTMTVEDVSVGKVTLIPFGQKGTPMGCNPKGDEQFLARVAILHEPRKTPGIANFWSSQYLAPGEEFGFDYYRTGTPVTATARGVLEGKPRFPDFDVVVNPELTKENVGIIKRVITARHKQSMLGLLVQQRSGIEILSIDLQSPRGVRAEVTIVPMQREASEGKLHYLNIPVHTKSFNTPEFWMFPEASTTIIAKITSEVKRGIKANGRYAAALHALVHETEGLIEQHRCGKSVPTTRYALAARAGLMGLLAGYELQVNCRSGKDRTGIFDTEIKFTAYQLWRRAQGLEVSAPGAAILPGEKKAWEMLLLRSGNREIQHLNAGVPGNVINSEHLRERVGDEFWADYVGDSKRAED